VKRSEPVALEHCRRMNSVLPQAPLARALGAEESCVCISIEE